MSELIVQTLNFGNTILHIESEKALPIQFTVDQGRMVKTGLLQKSLLSDDDKAKLEKLSKKLTPYKVTFRIVQTATFDPTNLVNGKGSGKGKGKASVDFDF